jgi:hypothetical protein
VVADERDVIGVRTNVRGEPVFLYRIQMPIRRAREGSDSDPEFSRRIREGLPGFR